MTNEYAYPHLIPTRQQSQQHKELDNTHLFQSFRSYSSVATKHEFSEGVCLPRSMPMYVPKVCILMLGT